MKRFCPSEQITSLESWYRSNRYGDEKILLPLESAYWKSRLCCVDFGENEVFVARHLFVYLKQLIVVAQWGAAVKMFVVICQKQCVETCYLFYTLHENNGTTGCAKFTVETCLINASLIYLQIWCVFSIALPLYTIYHHNNEYYDDILITTTPLTAFGEEAQRGGFSCSSF